MADELAGELDLAGSDGLAAVGVTGPALADPQLQLGGNPADQRVMIEAAGGERLQCVAPQPGQQPGRLTGVVSPGRLGCLVGRSGHYPRPTRSRNRAGQLSRRSLGACRTGEPMLLRNKERVVPQAGRTSQSMRRPLPLLSLGGHPSDL